MHLFLIDLYVSLDTLAPIIDQISPKRIVICNINPTQNYKNDKLLKYLLKKNIRYIDFLPISKNKIVIYFILRLLTILPCILQKKFQFFWNYIYYKCNLSSKKLIKNLLINLKISSITYDEGLNLYTKEICSAAKEINIPVIHIPAGMNVSRKFTKLSNKNVGPCDFYIAPNYIRQQDKKNSNFKIKYFGSMRYSIQWIKKIKLISNFKNKKKYKDKIRLGFFKKHHGAESHKVEKLINRLKKDARFEIKTREKPRDIMPLKCAKFNFDEYSSSELIEWADIIISTRPTSVLLEAIAKNKKIIFLEYLNKDLNKSLIYNYSFILKARNESQLLNYLIKKNKLNNRQLKKCIEKFLIDFYIKNKISNSLKNFYQNI